MSILRGLKIIVYLFNIKTLEKDYVISQIVWTWYDWNIWVCCAGIFWVPHQVFTRWILGFISWPVLLGDNCKCGLSFPWVIANGIKANLVMPCDSMALPHNVGSDKDVWNLSGRDCHTLNCGNLIGFECLIMYCVGVLSPTSGVLVDFESINDCNEP